MHCNMSSRLWVLLFYWLHHSLLLALDLHNSSCCWLFFLRNLDWRDLGEKFSAFHTSGPKAELCQLPSSLANHPIIGFSCCEPLLQILLFVFRSNAWHMSPLDWSSYVCLWFSFIVLMTSFIRPNYRGSLMESDQVVASLKCQMNNGA